MRLSSSWLEPHDCFGINLVEVRFQETRAFKRELSVARVEQVHDLARENVGHAIVSKVFNAGRPRQLDGIGLVNIGTERHVGTTLSTFGNGHATNRKIFDSSRQTKLVKEVDKELIHVVSQAGQVGCQQNLILRHGLYQVNDTDRVPIGQVVLFASVLNHVHNATEIAQAYSAKAP